MAMVASSKDAWDGSGIGFVLIVYGSNICSVGVFCHFFE